MASVTLEAWLLFAATETALCLSPGPAVLLVVSQGLVHGTRSSLLAASGVLTANAVWFAVAATGLGVALLASHEVFTSVKWAGAGYLVWLGVSQWRAAGRPAVEVQASADARAFWRGCVLQGANPRTLLYFTSLVPQFVDPAAPLATQIGILAATSIAIELAVLAGYGRLAARSGGLAHGPRLARVVGRAGGALLVAAGAGLAAARRG